MKSSEILLRLQRGNMTVFTTEEVSKMIGKPIGYARTVVQRIPGVRRAERGIYYLEQANIYEIASNIVPFSYVSMLSALRYYDLTTQMPVRVFVVTPKRHGEIRTEGYSIRFIRFRAKRIFGYVRRGNAFIAEPEKAVLDSLYYRSYAYIDEALKAGIEGSIIGIGRLKEYALRFGSGALINKLGFFLDFYCGISEDDLLRHRSRNPVFMAVGARQYSKKWRVYHG